MKWSDVGGWLQDNAGAGAALVGSLLAGNVPGAVAAGVSLVSSATGTNDPVKALEQLQNDPQTVVRLKELAYQNEASIREHIRVMEELSLKKQQDRLGDTQDARKALIQSKGAVLVSTLVVLSFAATLWAVFAIDIPASKQPIVFLLLGTLSAGFTQVLNFWLGSSLGSKEKTQQLSMYAAAAKSASMTKAES